MKGIAIAIPLVVALCFGLAGPRVAKRLPPRQATWLLSAGGSVAALSSLAVLSILGFVLLGQLPGVADEGHWSVSTIRQGAPADRILTVVALLSLVAGTTATLVVAVRRGLAVLGAYRSCRDLPSGAGELIVIDEARAGAVAIPGRPGRIVVARALLSQLSATERRALLAHERAHLAHGHHWHLSAVSLAAAANPLLLPLREAASHATERWADEEAAADIGDRRAVASAVARAALLSREPMRGRGARLAAGAHAVPARIAALLIQPPRPRPALFILTVGLLVAGVVGAAIALKETEHLFEFAGRTYRATHGY